MQLDLACHFEPIHTREEVINMVLVKFFRLTICTNDGMWWLDGNAS